MKLWKVEKVHSDVWVLIPSALLTGNWILGDLFILKLVTNKIEITTQISEGPSKIKEK